MFKKVTVLVAVMLLSCWIYAQNKTLLPPSGLMCDLVASGDYQSINGYAIQSSAENMPNKNVQSVLIGSANPAFSWEINSPNSNVMQFGYQILVADDRKLIVADKANVWDSGKVTGAQSTAIIFKGSKLKPSTAYYWKVRIWSDKQEVSGYSAPTIFYTDTALVEHKTPKYPLQITEQKPVSFTQNNKIYRADFGKDAFAQLKLKLYSNIENDSVTVRIGEIVDANGNINRKPPGNIRFAQYIIALHKGWYTYKLKINTDAFNTRPQAIRMPAYIGEVTPFRYCEVDGYGHSLKADDLIQLAVHYNFNDDVAQFNSSDTTLNAIWGLCKYSMKATSYLGIYVDGDRERIPYEADTYINQLSHYAVDKEYTLARQSHEYLITHATWPTEWILQSVLIGWNDYLYTGDIVSAKYNYDDLKNKTLLALADSTNLISTLNGKVNKQVLKSIHFNGELKDIVDWPHGAETDGFVFTKYNAVVNAFYYKALLVMGKLAADLGNTTDAQFYSTKASVLKKSYQQAFFDPRRHIYKDGADTDHASLHTNMFAMAFGLVDDKYKKEVQAFIKSRGMACSVYGSQFLLDAVYDAGDGDYGLSLLTSKTDRSWYNMLKAGSTITLEAWDNKYKPNQDWNHAWGAAAGNIISRKLMGVEPLTPGWTTFSVKPQIGSLTRAAIDIPTIKGTIKVAYEQTAQFFGATINIPANMQAKIYLPIKNTQNFKVCMDDKPVKVKTQKQMALIPNVGSGSHVFKVTY